MTQPEEEEEEVEEGRWNIDPARKKRAFAAALTMMGGWWGVKDRERAGIDGRIQVDEWLIDGEID